MTRTRNSARHSGRVGGVAAAALLAGLLCSCTNGIPDARSTASASPPATPTATPTTAGSGSPAVALQAQYESVIAKVLPSVVEITTDSGLGSGIVLDTNGNIVTNNHVVGNATAFKVRLASSATAIDATLVGKFPANDLAVIRVSGGADLHPATFADSDQVKVGEITLAMGNPLGLDSSVTDGIVSAVGRTLTEPASADSPGATLPDSIQTSAAINPGNSGGALVDLDGKVIGIPTLAASDGEQGGAAAGIGFAIPSNTVTNIAGQLVKDGKVTNSGRAALGVEATTVTSSSGSQAGVGVVSVTARGAAADAGIERGDVIVKVNGTPVANTQELSSVLATLDVGQKVPVVVVRSGGSRTVEVTLGQLKSG
jgi:putative serine protease PepD